MNVVAGGTSVASLFLWLRGVCPSKPHKIRA